MARKPVEFHESWIVKFGLEVSTRDVGTSKVTSVLCLFCKHCGRDDGNDGDDNCCQTRKRKRTTNIKYFTSPWRSDNFTSHLKNQHMKTWDIYRGLSMEEQRIFFVRVEKPEAIAMRSFVQPEASLKARIIAKQKCDYLIDVEIIDKLIGDMLFDTTSEGDNLDDVERSKQIAMKVFELEEDKQVYVTRVKSVLKLNIIVKFVEIGVSFRQASRLYQSVKDETGMGVMGSISDGDVASHYRVICAVNYQYLKEMLKNVWTFSIAIDAGNNAGTAYLDLRMRCYFKDNLQNLHLMAMPMREWHTGEYHMT
ncbi:hypothetical protein IV203_021544 [Nitzschia inconspicua]|uniref:Uncharacterized protein n=1 Tax=Nitzschia inconspicua TaxID=303405 RepID=A0A9K3KIA6_9STRA|nr:hypothetical protein IV203_021544 [Nitzschia inconspicua]